MMINRQWEQLRIDQMSPLLIKKNQERVFYESLEKVRGGVKELYLPSRVDKVVVAVVDQQTSKSLAQIKQLEQQLNRPIILISFCWSSFEIQNFLRKLGREEDFPFYLPVSAMTAYSTEGRPVLKYHFHLALKKIFPQIKDIVYVEPNSQKIIDADNVRSE